MGHVAPIGKRRGAYRKTKHSEITSGSTIPLVTSEDTAMTKKLIMAFIISYVVTATSSFLVLATQVLAIQN
jgi:hypothetical protein